MTAEASVLEQAKGYLDTQGWGKGDLVLCSTGKVCALGAVYLALGCTVKKEDDDSYSLEMPYGDEPKYGSPEYEAYFEAESEWVQKFNEYERALGDAAAEVSDGHERVVFRNWNDKPTPIRSVVSWNDHPSSTKQDVIDVFDRAINNLKEQQ